MKERRTGQRRQRKNGFQNDYGMRPYAMPNHTVKQVFLDFCKCGELQRGPKGGVCGHCGGAIRRDRRTAKERRKG